MHMNKKVLEIPLRLRKLEALIRRLPDSHPKLQEISDEYGRRMSGYRGEQSLQYYLSLLKQSNYFIFHNLRLPDISGKHFFEIDILLISSTFLSIIDAKHVNDIMKCPENDEIFCPHFDGNPVKKEREAVISFASLLYQ